MAEKLQAPFPYFGGKSRIADLVWEALGQPKHYIEPFFGSGAALLARPDWNPKMIETVCDKDGFVANVWRSLQFSPDETARWCDWPVNHADLMARKKALLKNEGRLLESLVADDKWHDPVMAGYWIWAASCWVGAGLTYTRTIPSIARGGGGVHKGGKVLCADGGGVQGPYNAGVYAWFRQLSERLRYVRVVCGDWMRVCGGNWQGAMGTAGMFFDPPFGVEDRYAGIYRHDSATLAGDVMKWVRERGKNPSYRIVLAGYEEHEPLLAEGWAFEQCRARSGYGNQGNGKGRVNQRRERLYFSPHCLNVRRTWSLL